MPHSKMIFLILILVLCFINIVLFFIWKIKQLPILYIYFHKIFTFIFPIGSILFLMLVCNSALSKKEYGITMDNQIKQQFDYINKNNYDTIILGNSRLYRGINPELLTGNCYNFAFDNDSFLECYYKLKYLEKIDKLPKRIILGVDYFEFSFISAGMKNTYDLYFDNEYDEVLNNCNYLSFDNEKLSFDLKINKRLNTLFIYNYYNAISYLYYKYILKDSRVSYVSESGQYKIYPQPKAGLGDFLTRSSDILIEQKTAYQKIIKFANEKNIKIIQIMLPLRDIEINCYKTEQKENIDNLFASQLNAKYLNFSKHKFFNIYDFMDDTHLNINGSNKFSSTLDFELSNIGFYKN